MGHQNRNFEVPDVSSEDTIALKDFLTLVSDMMEEEYRKTLQTIAGGFGLHVVTTFSGGKKIRPALVFLINQAIGGNLADCVGFAIPIELMHNATLAHDDILDGDAVRRGLPSLWANLQSLHDAVLIGDAGLAMSLNTLVRYGPHVIQVFCETIYNIARGASVEMRHVQLTEDWIHNVAYAKTAVLFGAAAHFGAISAFADSEICEIARQWGTHLGMAFQFADDTSDIIASQETNMPIGDILQRRPNLPIILLSLKQEEMRTTVQRFLNGTLVPNDIISLFNQHDDIMIRVHETIKLHLDKCDYYTGLIEARYGTGKFTRMMRTLPLFAVQKMLHDKTSIAKRNNHASLENMGNTH